MPYIPTQEREALQQRAKADAEDDRRADIRRTEKAAIDASRAHAAAVKAAEARAAREQDQKIKEFYLRRVTEVANQEVLKILQLDLLLCEDYDSCVLAALSVLCVHARTPACAAQCMLG
jgi:hypothetical protein